MVKNYGLLCEPRSRSLDGMPTSDFGWEIYPQGLVEALNVMKGYRKPMYIMENGIADADDSLRSRFIEDHLRLLDRIINEKKVDLRGYLHWSLIDNYEWAEGFAMKFGLYAVDLKTKKRLARESAYTYQKIIESNEVTRTRNK